MKILPFSNGTKGVRDSLLGILSYQLLTFWDQVMYFLRGCLPLHFTSLHCTVPHFGFSSSSSSSSSFFLGGVFLELVFRCFSCWLANLKLYNYIKTFWFWGITIVFGGEIVIHYYYSLINYTIPIYIYICLQVLILEIFTVFSFLVSHHCEQSPLLLTFTTWILDQI